MLPEKQSFTGLLPEDISRLLDSEPGYRGKQIFTRIHRGFDDFSLFTELPTGLRSYLSDNYRICTSKIASTLIDDDGTRKFQILLDDSSFIEIVVLTDKAGRRTACLSTQTGCAMGCIFCRTGQLSSKRNLTPGEIVEQLLLLKGVGEEIGNVVFMGMGEPFSNLEAVRKAIAIFHHAEGQNLGRKRITISTAGIITGIRDITANGPDVRLAVSLNSADPAVRTKLMPITKSNPLPLLKEALIAYQAVRNERITFEYVLIKGINNRKVDISLLKDYCRQLKVAINIIPLNPVTGVALKSPDNEEISTFSRALEGAGLKVTRRYRRGNSINGACGQLGGSLFIPEQPVSS